MSCATPSAMCRRKACCSAATISSNLRYGDEDARTTDVLRRAAEVAQATEFIDELPDGFETDISQGGTNVSGGQRQRLSIARALVKKAPVYIFDDTFSALDFKTDAKLRKALKGYTEGATVLIVAQRVSTIMHAEQIVVLDEGRVVGIGTHRELLAKLRDLPRDRGKPAFKGGIGIMAEQKHRGPMGGRPPRHDAR